MTSPGEITILRYEGADPDPQILAEIEGLPVIALGQNAFAGNGRLWEAQPPSPSFLTAWPGCQNSF